jgi:hypothetical protein
VPGGSADIVAAAVTSELRCADDSAPYNAAPTNALACPAKASRRRLPATPLPSSIPAGERTRPRVLAIAPRGRELSRSREDRFGEGAKTNRRGACAPWTEGTLPPHARATSSFPNSVWARTCPSDSVASSQGVAASKPPKRAIWKAPLLVHATQRRHYFENRRSKSSCLPIQSQIQSSPVR